MPKEKKITRPPTSRQVEQAENRKKAIALRNAGGNYRDIAAQMDVSVSTVHGWVQSEIAKIPAEETATLRRTEVERLDRLQQAVWTKALAGDMLAVREVVRIIDRRAKLLGLDAPQQVEIGVGNVDISATAQRILSELTDTIDAEVVEDDDDDG